MNQLPATDELLRRLLAADDDAGAIPAEHPDEETLALFAAGGLADAERNSIVAHLAACANCRQAVAMAMIVAGEQPQVVPLPATDGLSENRRGLAHFPMPGEENVPVPFSADGSRIGSKPRWQFNRAILALAACLLLAVGVTWVVMLNRPTGLTEGGVYRDVAVLVENRHFEQAKQKLSAAAADGVTSPRLRSLRAEAAREIPSAIALDDAGALTDFGYEYGGVAARGPSDEMKKGLNEANELLSGVGGEDLDVLLNRGHLRLTQGEPKLAVADFETATRVAGGRVEPWLGLGLAKFMLDDFPAAETAFQKSLDLDPQNMVARINLAMTLEEEDKLPAALSAWKFILALGKVSGKQREKIERHVAELVARQY